MEPSCLMTPLPNYPRWGIEEEEPGQTWEVRDLHSMPSPPQSSSGQAEQPEVAATTLKRPGQSWGVKQSLLASQAWPDSPTLLRSKTKLIGFKKNRGFQILPEVFLLYLFHQSFPKEEAEVQERLPVSRHIFLSKGLVMVLFKAESKG